MPSVVFALWWLASAHNSLARGEQYSLVVKNFPNCIIIAARIIGGMRDSFSGHSLYLGFRTVHTGREPVVVLLVRL
jgi:hypothetical protein